MALTVYQQETQRLLNDTLGVVYPLADLTTYINIGRGQLAVDSECLPQLAVITTVVGQRKYLFQSAFIVSDPPGEDIAGIAGILKVTSMGVAVPKPAAGLPLQYPMWGRPWQWFNYYYVQTPVPNVGMPNRWAVYQPGYQPTAIDRGGGQVYIDPIPDDAYDLLWNVVCVPIPLTDDTTVEAIPYPWTDAVPWYAGFYALMGAQRFSDANTFWNQYRLFARRGTQGTTPSILPINFPGGEGAHEAMGRNLIGGPADQR